jgi:hypothetical protein
MHSSKIRPGVFDFSSFGLNLIFNVHQAIILRDPLSPRRRARLQMASPQSNRQIRNEIIRRFSTPVTHKDSPSITERKIRRSDSFSDGADLVNFEKETVTSSFPLRFLHTFHIRNGEIIANDLGHILHTSFLCHETRPAGPIVFREGIFEKDYWVFCNQLTIEIR